MVRPIDISNVLNSLQLLGQSNKYQAELEREKKAKKSQFLGSIGSIGGGIVGGIYGGPPGAAAGSAAGSAIGQKAGGGEVSGTQVVQAGVQGYQMGSAMEQRQNNQQFNSSLSDNISANPNATPQQKQFAESIKNSNQDYTTTARQAQFLGVDPQSLSKQNISKNINSGTIDNGISQLRERQGGLEEGSASYQSIQARINNLENLKKNDLGKISPDSINTQVRREVPPKLEITQQGGMILARETDPVNGQVKTISLGKAQTDKQGLYKVPYYDENGNLKIQNYTDRDKAVNFANEKGSEVLGENKSIIMNRLDAAAKEEGKGVEYKVTQDVVKLRGDITKSLTKKGVTGETILPSEEQVDASLRDHLKTMAKTTTGAEKKVIQSQYDAVDEKIKTAEAVKLKEDTTNIFVSNLPEISPDLETTKQYIEEIKKSAGPENVDRGKALAALENLKIQQEKLAQQEQELVKQEEERKRKEEQEQEVERKKVAAGYAPWVTYKGKRVF